MSALFQKGDVVQIKDSERRYFPEFGPKHATVNLVARGSGPLGDGWCYTLEGSDSIIKEHQLEKVSLLDRMITDKP